MHTGYARPVADSQGQPPALIRPLLALVPGGVAGVATSLLQTVVPAPWSALVNAASPWLAVAFFAGAFLARDRLALYVGLATCSGEVLGYYTTAAIRGFPVSDQTIIFWLVCGAVAGPVIALLGRQWRTATPLAGFVAIGALAACFLLEAIRYGAQLHYASRAELFVAIAALLLATGALVRPSRRWPTPA